MIDFKLPADNRQGPSCGITALAVLAGVSFERVWRLVGENKPGNWKGSVNHHDIARALRKLKVRYRSRAIDPHVSIRRFAETQAKPGVVYLLWAIDHIVLLKDGSLLDQRGFWTMDQSGHWKLSHIYEVRDE